MPYKKRAPGSAKAIHTVFPIDAMMGIPQGGDSIPAMKTGGLSEEEVNQEMLRQEMELRGQGGRVPDAPQGRGPAGLPQDIARLVELMGAPESPQMSAPRTPPPAGQPPAARGGLPPWMAAAGLLAPTPAGQGEDEAVQGLQMMEQRMRGGAPVEGAQPLDLDEMAVVDAAIAAIAKGQRTYKKRPKNSSKQLEPTSPKVPLPSTIKSIEDIRVESRMKERPPHPSSSVEERMSERPAPQSRQPLYRKRPRPSVEDRLREREQIKKGY